MVTGLITYCLGAQCISESHWQECRWEYFLCFAVWYSSMHYYLAQELHYASWVACVHCLGTVLNC